MSFREVEGCGSFDGEGKVGGKRGGLRVIYFYEKAVEAFYMLFVYPKNKQEDLTPTQLRILGRLVREEFK